MLEHEVERLIDKYGVEAILQTMSVVSEYKAEHIMDAWQDRRLAQAWSRVARRLAHVAGSKTIRLISWKR